MGPDGTVALTTSGRLYSAGPATVLYGPAGAATPSPAAFTFYEPIATKLFITKIGASELAKHMLLLTNDGQVYAVGAGGDVRTNP